MYTNAHHRRIRQNVCILTPKFIAWTSKPTKHKSKQRNHFYFGKQSAFFY